MPCTSKKSEAAREELEVDGLRDVDAVITTRELGKMIKQARLDFINLPDEEFDRDYLGDYTGAGVIFGATGGVMEAALRTVADVLTGDDLKISNTMLFVVLMALKKQLLKLVNLTLTWRLRILRVKQQDCLIWYAQVKKTIISSRSWVVQAAVYAVVVSHSNLLMY